MLHINNTNDGLYIYVAIPVQVDTDIPLEKYSLNIGEFILILVVLILWIISILFCIHKYKKLRTLRSIQQYYSNTPKNINEVRIIENEHDAVIYKKNRRTNTITIKSYSPNDEIYDAKSVILDTIEKDKQPKIKLFKSYSESEIDNLKYLYSVYRLRCLTKIRQQLKNQLQSYSTSDKRKKFASSKRANNVQQIESNQQNILNNSQQKPILGKSETKQLNFNDDENNLINPNLIPTYVQEQLLYLHTNSQKNLSKSDSNLKQFPLMKVQLNS